MIRWDGVVVVVLTELHSILTYASIVPAMYQ
jgi:hypothetical protein